MTRPLSPKKQVERILGDIEHTVYEFYRRMRSHIPFEFTEQMMFETMVRPEDAEFVRRSNELYGHLRSGYYGSSILEIQGRAPDTIFLYYNRRTSFVPPSYLTGKQDHSTVNPAFFVAIAPWLEQVMPLRGMYSIAQSAISELRLLCGDDMSRIYALWPSIEVIAKAQGRTLPKLPRANGLPSPSPELREKLNVAQAFINSALMMPDEPMAEPTLRLELGAMRWWP